MTKCNIPGCSHAIVIFHLRLNIVRFADWDICLNRALRSRQSFFVCFGDFSMLVARIQLMSLCHSWGHLFIDKNKMAAMRKVYFL